MGDYEKGYDGERNSDEAAKEPVRASPVRAIGYTLCGAIIGSIITGFVASCEVRTTKAFPSYDEGNRLTGLILKNSDEEIVGELFRHSDNAFYNYEQEEGRLAGRR